MMEKLRIIILVAFSVVFLGISGSKNVRAAEKATEHKWGTSSKSGAELWAENCMLCHNLRSPNTVSAEQWGIVVEHMRVEANLTGDDARKILEFLQSFTR